MTGDSPTATATPLRVLHVVGKMDRAGIETWLMHVLRRLDRRQIAMDILVHTAEPGHFDDEVRSLGSRIIVCTDHTVPWKYVPALLRIFRREGPYDVVHSHVGHFSGLILLIARVAGVRVRIAHSHNSNVSPERSLHRRYQYLASWLIRQHATAGLAVSGPALVPVFGEQARRDERWQIFYLGIDLLPFESMRDAGAQRAELGLLDDTPVIGHIGRFDPQKNHHFLIEIFAEVLQRAPNAHLLLIGDGPLRDSVSRKVAEMGLSRNVHLLGVRSDVPDLLNSMDVLALPSLYEGLGLVLLESQAAGVPAVVSSHLTREACVVPGLVSHVALTENPGNWASAIVDRLERPPEFARSPDALRMMVESHFNIDVSTRRLLEVYRRLAESDTP